MKKRLENRLYSIIFLSMLAVLVCYLITVLAVPGKMTLLEGEEYVCKLGSPFMVSVKASKTGVVKLNNGYEEDDSELVSLAEPLMFRSENNGDVNLSMRVFGVIPLKTMKISVVPNRKLIASGNTIGVKMKVRGILVIGLSDVETPEGKRVMPGKDSGIKQGDLITEVNNAKMDSIDDLIGEIDRSNGDNLNIKYTRGDSTYNTDIKPVKSADDRKYHIGLWVRDSTAGIGTLTFYDPATGEFGALGHGITDIDTGMLIPIEDGEILESNILAVKKGKPGSPGELKGVFIEDRSNLGTIYKNSECGIYGKLSSGAESRLSSSEYQIASRSQVKEGQAKVLANIDGTKVEAYDIEIQKVSTNYSSNSKGMIIKITDKRLLDATGGIVQGMSGSPIIQNNKLIGAVTHVLVNDSTRGYGIFIENMLQNLESSWSLQKAG